MKKGSTYEMYRFNNNAFEQVVNFAAGASPTANYVPKIVSFSIGGSFMNMDMFSCPTCTPNEKPETLLVYLPTKKLKAIGKTSHFRWQNDGVYEFKEYKEGVNPDTLPLKVEEFAERPEDLLLQ